MKANQGVPKEGPDWPLRLCRSVRTSYIVQGAEEMAYLIRVIGTTHSDHIRLREPPQTYILGRMRDCVYILDDAVEWHGLLYLFEAKGRRDL